MNKGNGFTRNLQAEILFFWSKMHLQKLHRDETWTRDLGRFDARVIFEVTKYSMKLS